jgi:hypothetical protein
VYAHALHYGYLINTLIDKYPYNKLFSFQAVLHEFLNVNWGKISELSGTVVVSLWRCWLGWGPHKASAALLGFKAVTILFIEGSTINVAIMSSYVHQSKISPSLELTTNKQNWGYKWDRWEKIREKVEDITMGKKGEMGTMTETRHHFEVAEIVDIYMRVGHVYRDDGHANAVIGMLLALMRTRAGVTVSDDGR